jgi:hypothetical protein
MSGGSNGGMESYLPLALALGATVATGGAAAPTLGAALGAEAGTLGATMLGSAALGAGTSTLGGIMQGKSGSDILRNSLISGAVGGGTAGILGGLSSGAEAAPVGNDLSTGYENIVRPEPTGQLNPNAWGSEVGTNPANAAKPQDFIPGSSANPSASPTTFIGKPAYSPSAGELNIGGWGSEVGTNPANAAPNQNFIPGSEATPGASPTSPSSSFFNKVYTPTGIAKYAPEIASSIVASEMLKPPAFNPPQPTQGVPAGLDFKFDRNTYQPAVAPYYGGIASNYPETPYAQRRMGYADGGTVEQMSRENALGSNSMFPQAGLGDLTNTNTYQNPINTPTGTDVIGPTDAMTDTYTGQMKFAQGGIMGYAKGGDLGSYSDGGRMLKGPGDGMSDDIPAKIGKHQPARLADGEFVVPADVVSHLGNGSTDAGAKHLYAMMDKVRKARTGRKAQGKQIKPEKYIPA